jgi:hypothetical protein
MEMWFPRDRLNTENISASMDKQQTFSMVTGDYISGRVEKNAFISRVEAGSNTSTVAQRVVGADKIGSLKSETQIYGHKSHGTRTQK